jgi:HD-like signal output (HDOD) protein
MSIKERITDLVRDQKTQIPTLPVVLNNIIRVASSETASAGDLAHFIGRDQAMANKVLRLANSAYYRSSRQVDSITRAIVVIGFTEIVSLTIGMGVFSALSKSNLHGLLDMNDLWLHAIGSSFAVKGLLGKSISKNAEARRFTSGKPSHEEQAFLSGLLHDVGKVILAVYFPEEYRAVLEEAREAEVPLHQKERELLGLDHARMAGMIMERWNFPESISSPCAYHHNPLACPNPHKTNAMAVQLASFICHRAEIGQSGNPKAVYTAGVQEGLSLKSGDIKAMIEHLKEQRSAVEEFLKAIK